MSPPSHPWLRCSRPSLKRRHSVNGSGRMSTCSSVWGYLPPNTWDGALHAVQPQRHGIPKMIYSPKQYWCFAVRCFSQFSEFLPGWRGSSWLYKCRSTLHRGPTLLNNENDSLEFPLFKWLLTYPGRIFQGSSINTGLEDHVYKAISCVDSEDLEAEVFGLCSTTWTPAAPSVGAWQDGSELHPRELRKAAAPCRFPLPWNEHSGVALTLLPNGARL